MNVRQKKLAVVGLGYVGLPVAVRFGFERPVVAFDVDQKRVKELQSGIDRTLECSKAQLDRAVHMLLTNQLSDLADAQVFIVTVPTPVDVARRPDLRILKSACQMIGKVLKKDDIVVFESTVYPGATEEVCVPELEVSSGLVFNVDFFCGYSPERANPGDKVYTFEKITKITSGSTEDVAHEVDSLYREIVVGGTWKASSIRVAEAAKVIENSQRDLNIAFVNELSVIFERLGIDTMEVLKAAGSKWNFLPFKPGLVGGHCIGVDPYYLTHKAEEVGYNPQVILAGRRINDNMARYAARNVIKRMLRNKVDVARAKVAVLGVTFKENCPDTRNSKVFDLIQEFEEWGVETIVIDNWASKKQCLDEHGLSITSIEKCPKVSAVIVAVGHNEFRDINPKDLFNLCNTSQKPILGDLKSIYERTLCEEIGFDVFRL